MSFEFFFRKTEGDREDRGELGLGLLIRLTKGTCFTHCTNTTERK